MKRDSYTSLLALSTGGHLSKNVPRRLKTTSVAADNSSSCQAIDLFAHFFFSEGRSAADSADSSSYR